jgi:predicted NAD/FAD-dependent oxidoreductase
MSDPPTVAIVGAGLAGAKAAEALRAEGFAPQPTSGGGRTRRCGRN